MVRGMRMVRRRYAGSGTQANHVASDDFRDTEIGDDIVGVVGRAGQGRVRPDEGLTGAQVELDAQTGDVDPRSSAREGLLVNRNDAHRAGLEVDLDLFGDGEPKGYGED